ncbi:serine--tRNA ligase [Candidatus Pacearchaeota archaeon]|nr:serine--tRNA ligase [Candidatus Pacearchaeota archaeon]
MFDIKFLRENPDIVKENIKKKNKKDRLKLVDEIISKDIKWRALKGEVDNIRSSRNKISKEIADAKKLGKDVKKLLKEAGEIPAKIESLEKQMYEFENEISQMLKKIPNIMHKDVPLGKDDSENKEWEVIGKPRKFDFEVRSHAEIAENLGVADFDASAKTSGNGFYYLQGDLALLNQALIRFVLDKLVQKGFTYVETPLMLRSDVIKNVTDLNDMTNQIYKIEGEDLYLIGTSEHSLIGRYIDTIIQEKKLPLKFNSYSMCFRKEIGSHGIDEKGIYRSHQFNKIEMVVVCKPSESMKFFEELKKITVEIFKELGIPVRVLAICSGDLGDLKHIQVDIEAWSPRKKGYFEVGSCSNLTDAQARKLKIRIDPGTGEKYVPHTLNNTAIATSRAMVAILENYQQKDGTVKIPDVLVSYMYGKKVIGNVKQ